MVFDSRSENTLVVVGANFFDAVIGNPLSEKGRNIIRINREYGSLDDFTVNGLQYFAAAEYNIGRALDLLNAPSVV